MQIRRRTFLTNAGVATLGAFGLQAACSRRQAAAPESVAGAENWDQVVTAIEERAPRLLVDHGVPGLSIALIRDRRLASRRAFGVRDARSKAAVDTETVFEAGSMSKPVFAYAVLKLAEKGVLDLDAPLTRYTPDRIVANDPRLDQITARHVLTHTSGFQNWRTPDEPLRIHFAPGERWLYSGEGYYYLQSVVTRLTGTVFSGPCGTYEAGVRVCATDIGDFMRTNLLTPFGMTSSGYVWTETLAKSSARAHDAKGVPFDRAPGTAADAARYASAGGLHCTPADYARFLVEVLTPNPADEFRLSPGGEAAMVRPAVKVPAGGAGPYECEWALGWQVFSAPTGHVISHGGNNPGFHSLCAASRSLGCGYVAMTNGDTGPALLGELAGVLNRMFERDA